MSSKLGIALSRLALEQSTSLHKSLRQVIVLCLWTINLVCENSWSYVFYIFVDSEGEEEHPQQVPVNNVSSYDQTKQEQAIVQDIPSENLYYAESGQTNGWYEISLLLSSCFPFSPMPLKIPWDCVWLVVFCMSTQQMCNNFLPSRI